MGWLIFPIFLIWCGMICALLESVGHAALHKELQVDPIPAARIHEMTRSAFCAGWKWLYLPVARAIGKMSQPPRLLRRLLKSCCARA